MEQPYQEQLPTAQHVLRAAARRAYSQTSPIKNKLLQQLLWSMHDPDDPSTAEVCSLDAAASMCQLPASALLAVVRSDRCFRVLSSSGGSYSIGLNAAALLEKGRQTTKTGILVEELPLAAGYIEGKHPIRPGRQACAYWQRHGTCAYNKICVFNHTEAERGALRSQPRSRQQSPGPNSFTPALPGPNTPQPAPQPRRVSSTPGSSSGSIARAPGARPGLGSYASAAATQQPAPDASQPYTPQLPPPPQQQQQQQQHQQGHAAAAAGGGPSRPGAGPCRLFQIRGFCPQGARCPYDHPVSSTGHAAAATLGAVAAAVSQQSSRSASPLPFEQPPPYQQTQSQSQSQPDTSYGQQAPPVPPTPAPSSSQQQQQQQKEQQGSPSLLGYNELGYPLARGAANCAFFLGTGRCEYGVRCKFHHPVECMHPECVLQGAMPRKYDAPIASYARLVSHLQRLWDYGSCGEAQLKIWLAHHLLARENAGCSMFSPTAAQPAVEENSLAVPRSEDKPQGAYSCTLTEADQVLQLLWKAQPDAAASSPMPYAGRVTALLRDDPYYAVATTADGTCTGVKLRVKQIIRQLNF